MTPPDPLAAFLRTLHPTDTGWCDLRAITPAGHVSQTFIPVGDVETVAMFLDAHRAGHCYIGVATRRDRSGGALEHCAELWTLFIDLDFNTISEADARARLATFPVPPQMIVHSGGGLHCYWPLREPFTFPADAAIVRTSLRRLAQHFGGDRASAEPARVLRIPTTTNWKYPRPVTLEQCGDDAINASELDELLPPELAGANGHGGMPFVVPAQIAAGARNDTLYRLGRSLKARHVSADAIAAALAAENRATCVPPLPADEVALIVTHALQQPDRFETTPDVEVIVDTPATTDLTLTSLETLLSEPDDAIEWIVQDRLSYGSINLLAGKPKAGKSTLARSLAYCLATGRPFLGHRTISGPVWYLVLEDKRSEVRRHFRELGATGSEPVRFLFGSTSDLLAKLTRLAAHERPLCIIVDTLQRLVQAKDLNDYAEVTTKLTPVITLSRETGAAVILVHHAGKADRAGIDTVLGSTALAGSVDNIFLVNRTERYRLLSSIQRIGPDLQETVLTLDALGCTEIGDTRHEADVTHLQQALLNTLAAAGGGLTRPEWIDACEGRKQTKLEALRRTLESGTTIRTGAGTKADPYRYFMAGESDSSSQVPSNSREPEFSKLVFLDRINKHGADSSSQVPAVPQVPEVPAEPAFDPSKLGRALRGECVRA